MMPVLALEKCSTTLQVSAFRRESARFSPDWIKEVKSMWVPTPPLLTTLTYAQETYPLILNGLLQPSRTTTSIIPSQQVGRPFWPGLLGVVVQHTCRTQVGEGQVT